MAQGSINGVLTGKHYNRCIRAHKIVYEALQRLRIQAFIEHATEATATDVRLLAFAAAQSYQDDDFVDVSQDPRVDTVFKLYEEYIRNASESNLLFSFWSTYIELVQLLMSFIRATRESNWALHLSTLKSILPWFFATDRINYSRYASCYWLEMICLESTHPCRYFYVLFYYCVIFFQRVFEVLIDAFHSFK